MKRNNAALKAKIIFKLKHFIATLPLHILVMSGVAIISYIFGKWLEAVCFLVAFFSLRYKFPTTYHAKRIVHCMLITNAMFAVSIILCPSIYMYIFGSLLFGYLDAYILWYVQNKAEIKQQKEIVEWFARELIVQITDAKDPQQEFFEKCRTANLGKRDTEIAYKYYYEKQTPKEIWLWLCENKQYESIEWDSVYKLLLRIGNKLNIKNKA